MKKSDSTKICRRTSIVFLLLFFLINMLLCIFGWQEATALRCASSISHINLTWVWKCQMSRSHYRIVSPTFPVGNSLGRSPTVKPPDQKQIGVHLLWTVGVLTGASHAAKLYCSRWIYPSLSGSRACNYTCSECPSTSQKSDSSAVIHSNFQRHNNVKYTNRHAGFSPFIVFAKPQ